MFVDIAKQFPSSDRISSAYGSVPSPAVNIYAHHFVACIAFSLFLEIGSCYCVLVIVFKLLMHIQKVICFLFCFDNWPTQACNSPSMSFVSFACKLASAGKMIFWNRMRLSFLSRWKKIHQPVQYLEQQQFLKSAGGVF